MTILERRMSRASASRRALSPVAEWSRAHPDFDADNRDAADELYRARTDLADSYAMAGRSSPRCCQQ
jgi:hypothetical protein